MKSLVWNKAIMHSADPQRAQHFFDLLAATRAGEKLELGSDAQAAALTALFSGSQALSNWLVAHPEWLSAVEVEALKFPRRKQGLRKEVDAWLQPLLAAQDFGQALGKVRQFQQRELLRIGARDLARLGQVPEITQELSALADVCLESVWRVCYGQLTQRYGQPYHQDGAGQWQPTVGCVLGMGKLGGQELNYSSDVDVLFAYSEEGGVFKEPPGKKKTPRQVLTNH
ncbi:MAG TPA: hypothetical protein VNZ22_17125, partial [Bacillota bacterium]|nr:hypothetical protein [Bacillota bacterium]